MQFYIIQLKLTALISNIKAKANPIPTEKLKMQYVCEAFQPEGFFLCLMGNA
jgi:hypothetical protein